MIHVFWIIFVIGSAFIQWYIIEKRKQYPHKDLWFLVRVIFFLFFLSMYMVEGYKWYWAANFMIFTFWWPFNTILNWKRGLRLTYLSARNSFIDRMLLKVFVHEFIIFVFAFIALLFSVGALHFYGKCTWYQVVNDLCNY